MSKTRTSLGATSMTASCWLSHPVFARTACFASLVALLAPTVALYGHGSRGNEQSPPRQAPTGAYRGDDELTRLRDSAVRGDVQSAGTCVSFITAPHPTRSVADMSHRMMPSRSSGVVALRLTVTCGQVELWVRCTTRVEAFRKTSRKPCIGFKGLPLPE